MEPEQISWYKNHYNRISLTGKKSLSKMILHKSLERDLKGDNYSRILEIGGGEGQHIPYVKTLFENYTILDVRPELANHPFPPKVKFILGNADNIPLSDAFFDRVIVTCLLHHVKDPLKVLREIKRVAKKTGIITIFLPHDPGVLYRLILATTTFRIAKKLGILSEAQYVQSLEHQNSFLSLHQMIQWEFSGSYVIKRKTFPFPKVFWQSNLFSVYLISPKDNSSN